MENIPVPVSEKLFFLNGRNNESYWYRVSSTTSKGNDSTKPASTNFDCQYVIDFKGVGTLVDILQLSYSFHQKCSKLGTATTEDLKN
jgi:hypothetical protein